MKWAPYNKMAVVYRGPKRGFVAWLGTGGDNYREGCCDKRHRTPEAAARCGAARLALEAITDWRNAAKIPGTRAHEVLSSRKEPT